MVAESDFQNPDATEPEKQAPVASTRERVLAIVLEHGPIAAADVGKKLGLTAAAVRRHLDQLSADSIIEVKRIAGRAAGAGRPARCYVVSREGQTHIGNDYLNIASAALRQLKQVVGDDAVQEFAARRFENMAERYRPDVEAAHTLEKKVDVLMDALNRDGFVASTRHIAQNHPNPAMHSTQICQGHCPIQDLAREFPEFCEQEAEVFAELLGVDVRRLSTMAAGGHVCTTHVPVGRLKVLAQQQAAQRGEAVLPVVPRRTIRVSTRKQEKSS